MPRIPDDVKARLPEAYRRLGTTAAVAAEFGIYRKTVGQILRAMGVRTDGKKEADPGLIQPVSNPEKAAFTRVEDGDRSTVEFGTRERIVTVEDALRHAQVDTSVWRVERFSCTSWEVGAKVRSFEGGKPAGEAMEVTPLWRVRVELRRILPRSLHEATEAIILRMSEYAPKYHAGPPRYSPPADPHLLEVDLFDAHFGKYAWAAESGEDYDLKLAEGIYRDAVAEILGRASGYEIDRIVLPVGNDFFHFDSPRNQTTAGTPVDTDGRYAKVYEAGMLAVTWAVELLMRTAPVEVVWVPGNHDRVASFHLCRELAAWFRNAPAVAVDVSPRQRKFVRYGCNLIGYTHGDREKPDSLPVIMATERPRDWGETTCHEWRLGHRHAEHGRTSPSVRTHDGVAIRWLQSLSARDSWHYEQGYVGGTRAATGFLMSFRDGFGGMYPARVRLAS